MPSLHLIKKGITDPDGLAKAEEAARRKLAEIAEDRARLQILAYVDNPAVQSQLAFGVRNFARFYRATEDFYRRFYRAVRYNPESLARAALTYEGITHSGWVQKDDQGEDYSYILSSTSLSRCSDCNAGFRCTSRVQSSTSCGIWCKT
jgi:hypothetical protein